MELWTALLLGLAGSTHCAGMCGPLALAMPSAARTRPSYIFGRIAYNLGRVLTYSLVGVIFGCFGKTLLVAGLQRVMSISLGVLLLVGLFTARRVALWRPVSLLVERVKSPMGVLLRRGTLVSQFTLGLLNGWLPCGLVYVAAIGATASGEIASGAAYMAAFGLGTLPMMLMLGFSAKLIPFSLRFKLRGLVPVSIFVVGTLLILRGMALGIPYVSPNLAHSASCCHSQ
jgi:uncharacterized protein